MQVDMFQKVPSYDLLTKIDFIAFSVRFCLLYTSDAADE